MPIAGTFSVPIDSKGRGKSAKRQGAPPSPVPATERRWSLPETARHRRLGEASRVAAELD